MASTLAAEVSNVAANLVPVVEGVTASPKSLLKEPLKLKGVLDAFESFDVTPAIGREFPNANLKEWLRAPNSDELLRDLAITGERALKKLSQI